MDFTTAPTLRPRARSARKKISQRAKLEKIVYKKSKNKFPLIFSAPLSLHSRRSCVRCYLVTTTLTKEKAPSAHRFPGLSQKNTLQILVIFSAQEGDVLFGATVRNSGFHMYQGSFQAPVLH